MVLQQGVPQLGHIAGGGLAGLYVGSLGQIVIKLLLGQGDVLQKQLVVDIKRHGQHPHAQLLALRLGDAAVAVRHDGDLLHNIPLSIYSFLSIVRNYIVLVAEVKRRRGGRQNFHPGVAFLLQIFYD